MGVLVRASFFRPPRCGRLAVLSDRSAQHLGLPAFELLAAAEIPPSNSYARRKIQVRIVLPTPPGHGRDAELPPDLRIGYEGVYCVRDIFR
jgi:hypothetical protein